MAARQVDAATSPDQVVVPGAGPVPCPWMLVGEKPGREEAAALVPFVGRAGGAQDAHLRRNSLSRSQFYITNIDKGYHEGNPYPTPEAILAWTPAMMDEIRRVRPGFIVAVGQCAMEFFLGPGASLAAVHGIPMHPVRPEPELRDVIIVPIYHPAAAFYSPETLQYIAYDYSRVAAILTGKASAIPAQDTSPDPSYVDAGDGELVTIPSGCEVIALDTEGRPRPGEQWSFQVSGNPGLAAVCRASSPRFGKALTKLAGKVRGKVLVGHNLLYEFEMMRSLGVDLLDPDLGVRYFDTMMAAYLLCVEPQGLKELARRWCGMEMRSYAETVGPAGLDKQLRYLEEVMSRGWPKPEPRVETGNDGTSRLYMPQPISRRAEAILLDYYSGKLDKDGDRTDPAARWRQVDRDQRRMVERSMGPFPVGTLDDIPLEDAIHYAGRDPDATLRLYHRLRPALESAGLMPLMGLKMAMLPAAAEMKINGMLARLSHFEHLSVEMQDSMDSIREKISHKFFSGRPFNPASSDQVAVLMRRRGLVGEKRTPTGKVSTAKKSIEHLRFEDGAIAMVEDWREHQKVKDSFAGPIAERFPDGVEVYRIQGDLKVTRVTSGRFAMSDPNLLAIPVRNELGLEVRRGFIAEDGYTLGSWDLDQAEMRVMADESGDERMVKIFVEGKVDIHTDTASRIFGVPYGQVDKKKHRYPSKRAGFGVITGIQDQGLLDQLRMAGCEGWDLDSVGKLRREWFKLYPGVKRYMEACREGCRANGGVIRDRWGMPRYLPAILSEDRFLRWEAERQTHSHRIQGGAQGYLQHVMAYLHPVLRRYGDAVRWLLQIHDSILLEVMLGMEDVVDPIVVHAMAHRGGKLKVPMGSKGSFALNWGDMKD